MMSTPITVIVVVIVENVIIYNENKVVGVEVIQVIIIDVIDVDEIEILIFVVTEDAPSEVYVYARAAQSVKESFILL